MNCTSHDCSNCNCSKIYQDCNCITEKLWLRKLGLDGINRFWAVLKNSAAGQKFELLNTCQSVVIFMPSSFLSYRNLSSWPPLIERCRAVAILLSTAFLCSSDLCSWLVPIQSTSMKIYWYNRDLLVSVWKSSNKIAYFIWIRS